MSAMLQSSSTFAGSRVRVAVRRNVVSLALHNWRRIAPLRGPLRACRTSPAGLGRSVGGARATLRITASLHRAAAERAGQLCLARSWFLTAATRR